MTAIQPLLQQYFRNKTSELLAAARQAICEHPGLRGSHREDILRIYLGSILPKRFAVGRGMVYGLAHRSRESDIVIWDSSNYPSLALPSHNLFFAESVRAVLEIKSEWNSANLEDILTKSRATRDIVIVRDPNLADDIAMLQLEIDSIRAGRPHEGFIFAPHHIATGAIVLFGGSHFQASSLTDSQIEQADDSWPDALILLEEGRLVLKHYEPIEHGFMGGRGYLEFLEAGEDALLIFTAALLALITERSVQIEDPLYLLKYTHSILNNMPSETIRFGLTRPIPGRQRLW